MKLSCASRANFHQHSEEGARVVLLLSVIMRFSLEASAVAEKVLLRAELEQVRNLLGDQPGTAGWGGGILDTCLDYPAGDWEVIPLVLLALMENMFKHGRLDDRQQPGLLHVSVIGSRMIFTVRNLAKQQPHGLGTGLTNARGRLEYAYGNWYSLETYEAGGWFGVVLGGAGMKLLSCYVVDDEPHAVGLLRGFIENQMASL